MPVPSTISDLSTTAGSNSPAGSESPALIDDYLRAHGSFIATLRDGKVSKTGDETVDGAKTFSSNLGIGAAPSAWRAAEKAIDIGGYGAITGGDGTNLLRLYSNAYTDSTSTIRYKQTAAAALYSQTNGAHSWSVAPSGTAGNAVIFSQAMTLDASGNLGVGTTLPASRLNLLGGDLYIGQSGMSSGNQMLRVWRGDNTTQYATFSAAAGAATINSVNGIGGGFSVQGDGNTKFLVNSSGNVLINKVVTATDDAGHYFTAGGQAAHTLVGAASTSAALICRRDNTTGYATAFVYGGNTVGNISITGSATSYNTSSDYRLKHDIAPMQNALQRVEALKPVTYKWNADGSDGEGFIAHELAEVCPQAVTGEKDAVDAAGKPVYQGIDTSFLVATLTAAIQEQQAIIADLRSRIEALEAK